MAGAGKGNGKGPGIAAGAVFGGFCLLGIILFAIAAAVVLSLISLYTPNRSKEGNGDYFQIQALGLKLLSTNGQTSLNNGSVADSTQLSTLCSTMYTQNSSPRNFAGCVMKDFRAFTANNSNTSRRRRQNSESGFFLLGAADIYYTTTCGKRGDANKGSNGTGLSSCVRSRLAECNALIGASSLNAWTPIPSGMTLSIVNAASTAYNAVPVARLFGLSTAATASYARARNISDSVVSLISLGCVYVGPVSPSTIAAALAAQSTATTTAPTSTSATG